MFQQILFVNWKAARFGMIPFIMAAFALPLLSVRSLRFGVSLPESASLQGARLLTGISGWAHLYPALAFALGTVLALVVWNWDHRGEHVYALSLPVPRWKYVLLKMGAGATLLLVPVLALWIGSLLAVSITEIPDGLRGYPTAITFRFLLATLISFAVFFALAAGTMRTAVLLLIAWVLLLFLGETVVPFLGRVWGQAGLEDFHLLRWMLNAALSWPGPFEVMAGNWMLIDV